ncbi:PhzF family phenazine biosynthesis protein [Marinimicrobium sp. C2-29]|uniref:PhzF family phenazine biosynthesis protein n=1 Tax=Marinimicrobium sp. C2-29 TaxID=3139825 RepID=UPI0031397F0B
MILEQYQIDAFASRPFEGNPAAVVPLTEWLDEALMQSIAAENNLAETAFFVPEGDGFQLRWFTPVREVDLCGHATLASAHVLFEHRGYEHAVIRFGTRSGDLYVERRGQQLAMDFPAVATERCEVPEPLLKGLGVAPVTVEAGMDYLVVLENEAQVRELQPDLTELGKLDRRGVMVTARGNHKDFVSRFFCPKGGIPEDPVTGSAHCALAPYWGKQLDKSKLNARQLSRRGGDVDCELKGERVTLLGQAVTTIIGEFYLPA